MCRNGYLNGGGGLNFIPEKSENFHFSCIVVINATAVALLIHMSTVLNGIDIS